jgi:hypothetical protein
MCLGPEFAAAMAAAAPYIAATSAAVGTGATLYGAQQSSAAQSRAAEAVRQQNVATTQAQNQAFLERMAATKAQSDAQFATGQRETQDRTTQAMATRAAQNAALDRQNQTVNAENQTADQLRAAADARAQELLQSTAAPGVFDKSQQGAQDQAAMLLAASQAPGPTGPAATDPSGSGASTSVNDPVMKTALARRMGIAAANIRQYGSDIARVASYGQPLHDTGQAVTENQTAIMPTQAAEKLLAGGSNIRLLPSQIAYRNATDYGGAVDQLIQQRAAGENQYAGLQYGNTTGSANLRQSDADTQAANAAAQAKADAQWQQQVAGLYSGIGQLGLYGAGRYGPAILPGASGLPAATTAPKIIGDGTGGFN